MRNAAIPMSKSSIIIISIIAILAILLSVSSYLYSQRIADQITQNALLDVRQNTERKTSDISSILENKIKTVVSNLHVIAEVPSVERGEDLESRILFDTAENTIGPPLDFVAWLNSDGKLIWSSNVNATQWEQYGGIDLSSRTYFIEARDTRLPYFSSVIESVDNIPRLFMSVPIVDSSDEFRGIVYAGYRLDQAANLVRSEAIEADSGSRILLLSKDGLLLHGAGPEFIGQNLRSEEVQSQFIPSAIPEEEKQKVNDILTSAVRGESGSADVIIAGATNTVAFEPVTISGNHFMTIFVLTPHVFAADTTFLIAQQQNIGTITIVVIGTVSLVLAFLVLRWNNKLQILVEAKTAELKVANTSLSESNRNLQQANEQLKMNEKMQKEFINIAAHELRTPVQPLLGIAEQLEDIASEGIEDVRIGKEEIEIMARNAKRLTKLTADILEVARIESNNIQLYKEQVDLHESIQHAIEDSRSFIAGQNVKIIYEPCVDGPAVAHADRSKLFTVLSNLIENSIKFTKEGSITVRLEKNEEGHAVISVTDTGAGIHPDIAPRLFTKFTSRSEKGTGLGLYISKNIIESHGGTILAQNNDDGRGATFTFTLPLQESREIGTEIEEYGLQK